VRTEAPLEACGLLLGQTGAIRAAVATRNVALHPERSFEIDPAALLREHRQARGRSEAVIGNYHSHPDGSLEPSRTDAARAIEDGQLWLLVGHGRVAAWQAVRGGALHGRFASVELRVH